MSRDGTRPGCFPAHLVTRSLAVAVLAVAFLAITGCYSPYNADRGAVLGGLGGAGVGALVGHAVGHTGAGAAIGAGVGALSGAAVGNAIDESEARNRAMIEATMQRQISAGAVSLDDVIAMTRAGVSPDLIVNHVRAHGMARPLQTNDLIILQQQGVNPAVVRVMQEPPTVQPGAVVVQQPGVPVIVDDYYYRPYYPPYYYYAGPPCYRPYHPGPRVGVGVTFR